MSSIQAKMVSGLFKLIGVNKMLDKQGADFEKLLESYKEKQNLYRKPGQSDRSILKHYDKSIFFC